jgi:hypothetical protein
VIDRPEPAVVSPKPRETPMILPVGLVEHPRRATRNRRGQWRVSGELQLNGSRVMPRGSIAFADSFERLRNPAFRVDERAANSQRTFEVCNRRRMIIAVSSKLRDSELRVRIGRIEPEKVDVSLPRADHVSKIVPSPCPRVWTSVRRIAFEDSAEEAARFPVGSASKMEKRQTIRRSWIHGHQFHRAPIMLLGHIAVGPALRLESTANAVVALNRRA